MDVSWQRLGQLRSARRWAPACSRACPLVSTAVGLGCLFTRPRSPHWDHHFVLSDSLGSGLSFPPGHVLWRCPGRGFSGALCAVALEGRCGRASCWPWTLSGCPSWHWPLGGGSEPQRCPSRDPHNGWGTVAQTRERPALLQPLCGWKGVQVRREDSQRRSMSPARGPWPSEDLPALPCPSVPASSHHSLLLLPASRPRSAAVSGET